MKRIPCHIQLSVWVPSKLPTCCIETSIVVGVPPKTWKSSAWTLEMFSCGSRIFMPTGWKPNQRFACFYVFHGVKGVGVGWGGVITFICTSSHIWCNATVCRVALPHIYDAKLVYVVLHFLTYMMLRYCTSSCTSSHAWCYATVRLFALPHMHDATLLYVFLHFLTCMMLRYCTSSCTLSHIWCYVIVRRLALPHMHDATLLYVFLHFLTYMMLRYCMSSCTSSHAWCYATVCRLAIPHIYDATLVYVVLHFLTYMMQLHRMSSCTSSHLWMQRCCTSSCTSSHIWCYVIVRRVLGIQPCSMARFGRMFALVSGDGKTVPTKTSPSSLQKLWRTLSAEKKRVPLRCFTYPVKSTRVLFKETELLREMQNDCDLWYEINDEHCKRWKRGFDKQPAGIFMDIRYVPYFLAQHVLAYQTHLSSLL